MTEITSFKIDEVCGFSRIFIEINGVKFETRPVMGKLDEKEVKERLEID